MSFLLLLSAMLSAMTGAFTTVRVERAQSAVCACAVVKHVQCGQARSGGQRPAAPPARFGLPTLLPTAVRLPSIEPLFASRRRE